MAGTKISDLPSASTLTGAELVPVVQSDVTKKTTVSDIAAAVGAGTVTSVNVSGGTTGLTATGGPITTSGTITLGGTLDVDNGGTGATTAANARTNLGAAASGANSDITSLSGVTGGISTPDFIQFDTAAGATTAVGKEYWDDNSGGLSYGMKGGNVTQNTGQQTYQRVYNSTGSTIAKGSVVYVTGSSGTRITVAKAQATADATSATVLGVTAEAISNNSEGFVLTQGEITNISTTGISDGALLWLSPSTAGAFTSTKPTAPDHLVLVGYCIKGGSGGAGIIYVKMENGYELGELHDVYVSSPANGQTLIYNATNDRWENHNLTAGSGITITNGAGSITIASSAGSGTVTSVNVSGDSTGLTFSGGPITSSGTITMGGTLAVGYGGTGATTASTARTNLLPSYTSNAGKVLAVNTGATDVEWISAGGTGTVTSVAVSGGSTGLTTSGGPITSAGTITLAGTLGVGYGGTGQTTYTDGQLLIGNSTGNTLTKSTLTAGSGITITNGSGSITIAATGGGGGSGTVTSVDVSGGTTGLSFSGGPVTTSGTITMAGTLGIANGGTGQVTQQAAINALAGAQTSGYYLRGNGTNVSMSAIQAGDVPTLNQNTTGSAGSVANALTINNSGTGDASGSTYNGSAAKTISYNSIGASPLAGSSSLTTVGTIGSGTWQGSTIGVGYGGTGLTSGTSGGVLYYSAAGTLASSAALAANALVVGGGAGVAPSTITTGTGVVTALGVNTGSAGAFVVNGGALGTPSSGTVTNLTGTASININGTVGATTPTTGAFTTVAASSTVTLSGLTASTALALDASKNVVSVTNTGSGNNVLATSPTLTTPILGTPTSGNLSNCTADGTNSVGYRNIPQSGSDKTTSYTLATTDVGKFIGVGTSGSITVPNSTFAAGDVVSIFNNTSGNVTLTMSITTAYIAGTNTDKDTLTLATRGVATILFISGTVCVVSGNVT